MSRSKAIAKEWVRIKDLQVGDVVFPRIWDGEGNEKGLSAVVSKVSIVPVARRPDGSRSGYPHFERDLRKHAIREVIVTDPKGRSRTLGYDGWAEPTDGIERQCAKEKQLENERNDTILRYRVGVRTVLSRCETDIVDWKNSYRYRMSAPVRAARPQLDGFLARYEAIMQQLVALDEDITRAAGRDPERDGRKPVNKDGRRRG